MSFTIFIPTGNGVFQFVCDVVKNTGKEELRAPVCLHWIGLDIARRQHLRSAGCHQLTHVGFDPTQNIISFHYRMGFFS